MSRVVTPELEDEIRRLYVPHVVGTYRVAEMLGISRTTVLRVLNPAYAESNRSWSRAAKQRRRGTCSVCGAETRYNGKRVNGPSRLCTDCGQRESAERMRSRRGTGPFERQILGVLALGPRRFSEIRDELGTYSGKISQALHRLHEYGLVYRPKRGVYALAQAGAEDPAKLKIGARSSGPR